MPATSHECLSELKAFVRGGQLEQLGKVMPNIFRAYDQPADTGTRLLWQAGLDMDDIKFVLKQHGARPSEATPWVGQCARVSYPRDIPPPWVKPFDHEDIIPKDGKRQRTCAASR